MKTEDLQLTPICALEEGLVLDDAPFYLDEGLIYSYPIDRVLQSLKHTFYLNDVTKEKLIQSSKDVSNGQCMGSICAIPMHGGTYSISMVVPNNSYNINKLDGYMQKYGYMQVIQKPLVGGTVLLNYEKRFDNDATELVSMANKLYHICPKDKGEKACRIGLTPHMSQGTHFISNDERVYLSFRPYTDQSFKVAALKTKMEKQIPLDREYILIEVDTKALIAMGMKFYIDPRMPQAIYTHESIPAHCMKIIKTDQ